MLDRAARLSQLLLQFSSFHPWNFPSPLRAFCASREERHGKRPSNEGTNEFLTCNKLSTFGCKGHGRLEDVGSAARHFVTASFVSRATGVIKFPDLPFQNVWESTTKDFIGNRS
jgi:hypothetical protein